MGWYLILPNHTWEVFDFPEQADKRLKELEGTVDLNMVVVLAANCEDTVLTVAEFRSTWV